MKSPKLFIFVLSLLAGSYSMASGSGSLRHADIDSHDQASLQNGVRVYVNYCQGCHSLQYLRYSRMAEDLGLTKNEVQTNLNFINAKFSGHISSNMPAKDSSSWFGKTPPDLSLVGRSRGKDWLYTYLTGFYKDDSKLTGTNNVAFKDVGMPHVLAGLQGLQTINADGHLVYHEGNGTMTKGEYDKTVLDLVNFLVYASEPIKNTRTSLGIYVILFLLLMFIVSYMLKKEFWKDIH